MKTVPFERLRDLRDAAAKIDSRDIEAALDELIHLRASRIAMIDGVEVRLLADARVNPGDLR